MARRTKPTHNLARRFMQIDKATRGCMLDLLVAYEHAAACQQAYATLQEKIDALEEQIREMESGRSLTAKQQAQVKRLSKQVDVLEVRAEDLALDIDAAEADLDGLLRDMKDSRSCHVAELELLFNSKA